MNETSPTTSATGPSDAAAEPSAVDTTPSIPLAPRFERTVIARSVDGSQPSRSRTGIELPGPQDRAVRQRGGEGGERRALERLVERGRARRPSPARRPARRRPSRASTTCAGRSTRGAPSAPRAVAVASAWTKVTGRRAGSRQPPSPSITTSPGRTRSSSWRIGLDVGMAPVRMTRSGRWASIHGPGRTSWSARLTTRDRSCGPVRRPDSGSARIGKPVASARPASAAGSSGSSSGPATMRPRGVRPSSAASSASSSSSRTGRPAMADVNGVETLGRGRAPSSAAPAAPSGSSGSRNGTLSCTAPAGPAAAVATARPATRADVRLGRRVAVEQRQLRVPLGRPAVDPLLVDRLGRAAVAQLGWPVRAEHDQRHPRLLGLDRRPGANSATAVPDVARSDDRPAARARRCRARRSPRPARRAAPGRGARRASRSARASGVERDPGQTTASVTPAATSSAANARRSRASLIASSSGMPERGDDRLQLDPRLLPLEVRVGVGDDPAAGEQRRPGPVDDPAPERDAQLPVAVRAEPADRARRTSRGRSPRARR